MKERILIGITGGIGSGKSQASAYLLSIGENVIDSDQVSRQVVMPGEPGCTAIRQSFGDEYFLENGILDRKKLAACVFDDEEKLELLNSILHPVIAQCIYDIAGKMTGRVFIEVPLLIQSGMHNKMGYVWLIVADIETRIKRVVERDGLSVSEVKKRIDSQMSDIEMGKYADEIIENNGSERQLERRINELLEKAEYSG